MGLEELEEAEADAAGVQLRALRLSLSPWQDVNEAALLPVPGDDSGRRRRLETAVLKGPIELADVHEAVPLLSALAPLLPQGRELCSRLPPAWLDLSARNDAFGARCLFASRRHESSVFAPVPPPLLLRPPRAAREWQPALAVPGGGALGCGELAAGDEPWSVQLHPTRCSVRVLLRPGALLLRMLRSGTALPAARFAWRVVDGAREPRKPEGPPATASSMGEFMILSNVEDAAHENPPRFKEFPLRCEQLRSLGWMVLQERRRHEPFVAELRSSAACPDAPHWRLEGALRCEYADVKGGVLADAIGYGKTACTIGLIDCTAEDPAPEVPAGFLGFVPSRATLVLTPTNLHGQWLGEITKFTGKHLKVLSVPTCAQLKSLTPRDIAEADVVVATYRIFYSTPYLKRLEELARLRRPTFKFPRLPSSGPAARSRRQDASAKTTADWAGAYRTALEALSALAVAGQEREAGGGRGEDPRTPLRPPAKRAAEGATTPQPVQGPAPAKAEAGAEVVFFDEGPEGPQKRPRCGPSPALAASALSMDTPFVPLEVFWWKRVVCDEFHELLSRYPPAQVAVEHFRASYKWGLSGTPPCQSLQQIRKAASFLGVQLPAAAEDGGEAPAQLAQEWLDAFVRRNTAELPPLEEEEQIVQVRQTPQERALYLALTEQQRGDRGAAVEAEEAEEGEDPPQVQLSRQSTVGLLKLCSHFCPAGAADVLTADDECRRQLALRQEQLRALSRKLKPLAERAASIVLAVRHFEPHFCRTPVREDYGFLGREPKQGLVARLKYLREPTDGTAAQLLDRLFAALADGTEVAKEAALAPGFDPETAGEAPEPHLTPRPGWLSLEALAWEDHGPSDPEAAGSCSSGRELVGRAVREALATCSAAAGPPARCARLRARLGMPRWPGTGEEEEKQRRACQDDTWKCLREPQPAAGLREALDAWKAELEQHVDRISALQGEAAAKLKSLQSFHRTLQASRTNSGDPAEPAHRFAKYGSKIEALVRHVQRLQKADAECKIICFVQWEDLKRKISSALTEFEVEHLTLGGSVWARRSALRRFQCEADSPRMLLLSLEESASGTNLTASNHVIIVHPMEAATREEAVAFEMQAVGRVRRPGQQRKIHVWRFVTVGTIEQRITEEHRRDLWERQHAGGSQLMPNPIGMGDESDVDALEAAEVRPTAVKEEEQEEVKGGVALPFAGFANLATQPCQGAASQQGVLVAASDFATQACVGSKAEHEVGASQAGFAMSADLATQACAGVDPPASVKEEELAWKVAFDDQDTQPCEDGSEAGGEAEVAPDGAAELPLALMAGALRISIEAVEGLRLNPGASTSAQNSADEPARRTVVIEISDGNSAQKTKPFEVAEDGKLRRKRVLFVGAPSEGRPLAIRAFTTSKGEPESLVGEATLPPEFGSFQVELVYRQKRRGILRLNVSEGLPSPPTSSVSAPELPTPPRSNMLSLPVASAASAAASPGGVSRIPGSPVPPSPVSSGIGRAGASPMPGSSTPASRRLPQIPPAVSANGQSTASPDARATAVAATNARPLRMRIPGLPVIGNCDLTIQATRFPQAMQQPFLIIGLEGQEFLAEDVTKCLKYMFQVGAVQSTVTIYCYDAAQTHKSPLGRVLLPLADVLWQVGEAPSMGLLMRASFEKESRHFERHYVMQFLPGNEDGDTHTNPAFIDMFEPHVSDSVKYAADTSGAFGEISVGVEITFREEVHTLLGFYLASIAAGAKGQGLVYGLMDVPAMPPNVSLDSPSSMNVLESPGLRSLLNFLWRWKHYCNRPSFGFFCFLKGQGYRRFVAAACWFGFCLLGYFPCSLWIFPIYIWLALLVNGLFAASQRQADWACRGEEANQLFWSRVAPPRQLPEDANSKFVAAFAKCIQQVQEVEPLVRTGVLFLERASNLLTFTDGLASVTSFIVLGGILGCATLSLLLITYVEGVNFLCGAYGGFLLIKFVKPPQPGLPLQQGQGAKKGSTLRLFNQAFACVPDQAEAAHRFVASRVQPVQV